MHGFATVQKSPATFEAKHRQTVSCLGWLSSTVECTLIPIFPSEMECRTQTSRLCSTSATGETTWPNVFAH